MPFRNPLELQYCALMFATESTRIYSETGTKFVEAAGISRP
jgi:hypothetical protein